MLKYLVSVAMLCAAASAEGKSLQKQLDGTWKLVSTEQMLADGTRKPNPLYGSGANLIYDGAGSMCAIFPAGDALNAYCGRYELNEAQQSISHNIEIKGAPKDDQVRVQDIGAGLSRYVSIDGDTLKLRTVEPRPGIKEETLTWKRDD